MNRQAAIKFLPLIEALARGEQIQFKTMLGNWENITDPSFDLSREYRIKPPEPVVYSAYTIKVKLKRARLRRWQADEVPVGAFFRHSANDNRNQTITAYVPKYSCGMDATILSKGNKYSWQTHYFMNDLTTCIFHPEYSWDGVNWYRCGVWEYQVVS